MTTQLEAENAELAGAADGTAEQRGAGGSGRSGHDRVIRQNLAGVGS
jgi:hypothetical protein